MSLLHDSSKPFLQKCTQTAIVHHQLPLKEKSDEVYEETKELLTKTSMWSLTTTSNMPMIQASLLTGPLSMESLPSKYAMYSEEGDLDEILES